MTSANATKKSVKDIMTTPVFTVPERATVREIAKFMLEKGIGALVVVNDAGEAVGLVSESDIAGIRKSIPFSLSLAPMIVGARTPSDKDMRTLLEEGGKLTAKDVMTSRLISLQDDASVNQALHRMLDTNVKHIPVLKEKKPVGIIARHDLLKLFAGESA